MYKRILIFVITVACCIIIPNRYLFAKTYYQKDNLFKIDVSDGWIWSQETDNISIKNPKTKNDIFIKYLPMFSFSDDAAKELLKKGMQLIIATAVESVKGSVISENERWIDGIYARQLEYTWHKDDSIVYTTRISFLYKNYLFTIQFSTQLQEENIVMGKMLETLKFLRDISSPVGEK